MTACCSVSSYTSLHNVGDTPCIVHRHSLKSIIRAFYDLQQSEARDLNCRRPYRRGQSLGISA